VTAVVAYADAEIAFVAGDTSRTYAGNVSIRACKVHRWSDSVLLAQAGEAEHLTKLIAAVLPLGGFYGGNHHEFLKCFRQLNGTHWNNAVQSYTAKGKATPEGTILIACASTPADPAQVYKLDFETARLTALGNCGADGTGGAALSEKALAELNNLRGSSNAPGIHLDTWAARCIEGAALTNPGVVDWPADMQIARPSGTSDRVVTYRRIASADAAQLAEFLAP